VQVFSAQPSIDDQLECNIIASAHCALRGPERAGDRDRRRGWNKLAESLRPKGVPLPLGMRGIPGLKPILNFTATANAASWFGSPGTFDAKSREMRKAIYLNVG
jgi:hypothetical protein